MKFIQKNWNIDGFNVLYTSGNIFVTENQQAIINDVIEVKDGVYLYKV